MLITWCLLSSIPSFIDHEHLRPLGPRESLYCILSFYFIVSRTRCLSSFFSIDNFTGGSDSIMVKPFATLGVISSSNISPLFLMGICLGPRDFMLLLQVDLDHVKRWISSLLKQWNVIQFLLLVVDEGWLSHSNVWGHLIWLVWQVELSLHHVAEELLHRYNTIFWNCLIESMVPCNSQLFTIHGCLSCSYSTLCPWHHHHLLTWLYCRTINSKKFSTAWIHSHWIRKPVKLKINSNQSFSYDGDINFAF